MTTLLDTVDPGRLDKMTPKEQGIFIWKRRVMVRRGLCPDCGGRLRKIKGKEYHPAAKTSNGTDRFFKCTGGGCPFKCMNW